jgi:hypothetical protein
VARARRRLAAEARLAAVIAGARRMHAHVCERVCGCVAAQLQAQACDRASSATAVCHVHVAPSRGAAGARA